MSRFQVVLLEEKPKKFGWSKDSCSAETPDFG
jgi:hypothetical protein